MDVADDEVMASVIELTRDAKLDRLLALVGDRPEAARVIAHPAVFQAALASDDPVVLDWVLEHGAAPPESLLREAIAADAPKLVVFAAERERDAPGAQIVELAVREGAARALEALVHAGFPLDGALHVAAALVERHAPDTISTLLRLGAEVDAVDAQGQTALAVATQSGLRPHMLRLLYAGARIDRVAPDLHRDVDDTRRMDHDERYRGDGLADPDWILQIAREPPRTVAELEHWVGPIGGPWRTGIAELRVVAPRGTVEELELVIPNVDLVPLLERVLGRARQTADGVHELGRYFYVSRDRLRWRTRPAITEDELRARLRARLAEGARPAATVDAVVTAFAALGTAALELVLELPGALDEACRVMATVLGDGAASEAEVAIYTLVEREPTTLAALEAIVGSLHVDLDHEWFSLFRSRFSGTQVPMPPGLASASVTFDPYREEADPAIANYRLGVALPYECAVVIALLQGRPPERLPKGVAFGALELRPNQGATFVDWAVRAEPLAAAPFDASLRAAFLATFIDRLSAVRTAGELRALVGPPPAGTGITSEAARSYRRVGLGLVDARVPRVTLALHPPHDVRELCALWGVANPIGTSSDMRQIGWRVRRRGEPIEDDDPARIASEPIVAGPWHLDLALAERPAGPLPEVVCGGSSAYDLNERGGQVSQITITQLD